MKGLARGLIKVYQHTWSQVMPPSCRFEPTCSQYTFEAIGKYGFFKGTWLGMRRFFRCHPWGGEGYDPVP